MSVLFNILREPYRLVHIGLILSMARLPLGAVKVVMAKRWCPWISSGMPRLSVSRSQNLGQGQLRGSVYLGAPKAWYRTSRSTYWKSFLPQSPKLERMGYLYLAECLDSLIHHNSPGAASRSNVAGHRFEYVLHLIQRSHSKVSLQYHYMAALLVAFEINGAP